MEENVLYTFKYFIRMGKAVTFQIVTGDKKTIETFEKRLIEAADVTSAAREYVHEWSIVKMHQLVDIKKEKKEEADDEKNESV